MDFNVTDFNVRLRTIMLREAVLAIIIGFILNVVLVAIFDFRWRIQFINGFDPYFFIDIYSSLYSLFHL